MYISVNRNGDWLRDPEWVKEQKLSRALKASPSTINVCQHVSTSRNKLTYGSRAVELEVKHIVWRLSPAGDNEESVQITIRLRIGFDGSGKHSGEIRNRHLVERKSRHATHT